MEENKKRRVFNIFNITLSIIMLIFMFAQFLVWIITLVKDNSTINIFGYKPYLAVYNDKIYNFKSGDLVIGKELKEREYFYNTGVLYKPHLKNNKTAVILNNSNFDIIQNNSLNRFEGKINFTLKQLGKVILFFREIYIIIAVAIMVLLISILVIVLRKNSNKNWDKKFIRNRRIKDILLILCIISTYISIFLIGKVDKNMGIEIIDFNINKEQNNYNEISNNIYENNVDDNNINTNYFNNITTNNINTNSIDKESTSKPDNNVNNNSTLDNFNNIDKDDKENNIQDDNINQDDNMNQDDTIDTGILFTVTEDGKSWNQIKNLSIFNNQYFYGENKIAPGVLRKV